MSRRRRLTGAAVLSFLLLSAACGTDAPEGLRPGGDSPGGTSPGTPATYAISISGTVSGNPFTREGELTVRPTIDTAASTNGINPYEVCLRSGFPAGTPEPGAIWFGTNTGCFGAPQQIDAATVAVTGSTYVARPDESLSQIQSNGWTAAAGTTACLYVPVGGSATYTFGGGGTVTGTLELTGFVGACGALGNESTYSAEVTGTRA